MDPEDEVAFIGSVGSDPQKAKIAHEKKDKREEILAWKSWIPVLYIGPHKKFITHPILSTL